MGLSKTLKQTTREYILGLIREQHIKPGERLPTQRELASILHVSPKIPEIVLSEMEAEHLVERKVGRGTFVTEQSTTSLYNNECRQGQYIFLLLPTLRNPHYAGYAADAGRLVSGAGKTLHIITDEEMPEARDVTTIMAREGCCGIIAVSLPSGIRSFAIRHRIPVVRLAYCNPMGIQPENFAMIIHDVRADAKMLGEQLLNMGHREIWLAGDLPTANNRMDIRFQILERMICGRGGKVHYLKQKYPIVHYPSYEAIGAELAETMLQQGLPGTAAVFFNSPRAVGAMRYLMFRGIGIPERFSIAGFGPSCQNGFPEPLITSVVHRNFIETAVDILLLPEELKKQKIVVAPQWEAGSSCISLMKGGANS